MISNYSYFVQETGVYYIQKRILKGDYMTVQIYDHHPYASEYMAKIIKSDQDDKGLYLILDKTIFYPEGGGQPSDLGSINGIQVLDVQKVNGEIRHYVMEEIKDEDVDLSIDFKRRFVLMQNHLGQHIFSSVMEKLYSGNTVGFHIGDDYVTVDIDKKLNKKDIDEAENFANEIIVSNLKIHAHYPTDSELKAMPLRKQPKFTENIRVIEIDKFDFSPCGGVHPNTTGEVNLIKVRKFENYKSGVRIEFVCGGWALEDFKNKNEWIYTLAQSLSVKPNEVTSSVERLKDETSSLKKQIKALNNQLLDYKIKDIESNIQTLEGYRCTILNDESLTMDALRNIGTRLTKDKEKSVCLLTNNNQIIISASKDTELKIGTFFKENISKKGGKGGGNDYSAQGALNSLDANNIIEQFKMHLKNDL